MLVHLDKVHEPVHNTLPVTRPTVLEVDQCGVNVVTPGSEKQTLKINILSVLLLVIGVISIYLLWNGLVHDTVAQF